MQQHRNVYLVIYITDCVFKNRIEPFYNIYKYSDGVKIRGHV
jgi:hypothetical protein